MNTRQKKKQFKKAHGENPPKGIVLAGNVFGSRHRSRSGGGKPET